MSERMGRLCDELRIKLHGMDRRLEALKSNGAATFGQSQDVLESQLDRVELRIYDNRVAVEAANVRVKTWLAEKRADSVAGGTLRTERRKTHRLEARADEAALAVLRALLSRNDADAAVLPEMEPADPVSLRLQRDRPGLTPVRRILGIQ